MSSSVVQPFLPARVSLHQFSKLLQLANHCNTVFQKRFASKAFSSKNTKVPVRTSSFTTKKRAKN